ncbi:DUF4199 domain-containing protein [Salegentibacter salegens]|uniref:DUF4199 domain-containing protein n=1 Tax=Salegentibacter salegens TaxID=143223 RepID=A0A1M7JRY7_9FLAO|nr:DUF4199 domain-containing protein [Salegentibacter salegens]PRX51902.1 uncharacterized protein DUF4199 [Salegentibacter salegens]SHM55337.1 Protein of unknown function [Salegentibacter salegens]
MENSTSVKSVAYPYGIVLGIYSILALVLIYVFNVAQDNWTVGIINTLVSIIVFVLAIKKFKQNNSGFLSLKEALKVGLAVAVISGVIGAIYSYIHYSFVYPEFSEMMYDQAVLQMTEQGLSEAQQSQGLEMTKMFTSAWFFATMALVGSLFFGFIISLITGLILKRENPAHQ